MILQRYTFGSKSQHALDCHWFVLELLMILQRYTFGSKSQLEFIYDFYTFRCLWYCKDIHLEANHNCNIIGITLENAAYDIAKIYIWKQITTIMQGASVYPKLLMILQRYTFGSKSQQTEYNTAVLRGCLWYCKDRQL